MTLIAQVGATVPISLDITRAARPLGERIATGLPEVTRITKPDCTEIPSGDFPDWEYIRDGEWITYWDTSALATGEYHIEGRVPLAYSTADGGPTRYAPFKIHIRLTREGF